MGATLSFEWHGVSCFTIEAKNGDAATTLVTDPFGAEVGLKLPRNLSADVVTISHDHAWHNNLDAVKAMEGKEIFAITGPGEYEVGGLFVYGIAAPHDAVEGKKRGLTTLYRFEIGDLSFAHLGDLGTPIVDAEREALEDIDILLLPVGGNSTINAKEAVAIVNELEPKIVIPMHYAIPGMPKGGDPVDKFLKEIAATKAERVNRFKISKKDLPAEETKIIVLEKA
jgi:L-ascorbate metabolism protein UlaG (beta-lactamase superfamily)